MSYNINLQHIIFRTHRSYPSIPETHKRELLAFLNSISQSTGVNLLRINAYSNHVHILADLPASITISDYVQKLKSNSSRVFKKHLSFPEFQGWAKGYGSFSISRWDKDKLKEYIRNQENHHKYKSFRDELIELFGDYVLTDKYWRKDWLDENDPG